MPKLTESQALLDAMCIPQSLQRWSRLPRTGSKTGRQTAINNIRRPPCDANLLGFCCFPGVKPTEKESDLAGVSLAGVVAAAVLLPLLPPSSSETQQLLRLVAMLSVAASFPENPPRPQASRSAFGGEDSDRGLVLMTIGEGMAAPLLTRLMVVTVCSAGAHCCCCCVCVRWLSLAPAKSRLDLSKAGGTVQCYRWHTFF